MAGYWPSEQATTDDAIVAKLMNDTPKVVFSRTIHKAEWSNSTLVKDDAAEAIRQLKAASGKDIAIFGSNNLCVSLMRDRLVDEFRIMINPVVIGTGTPPFAGIDEPLKLKLSSSRTFESGNVLLCYERPVS